MSLSRKRKKELRKLQVQANKLWETQQVLVGEAADIAREAGRQLGHFGREQVDPRRAGDATASTPRPYVDKSNSIRSRFCPRRSSRRRAPSSAPHCPYGMPRTTPGRVWLRAKASSCPTPPPMRKKADKYGAQASKKLAARLTVLDPPKQGMGAGGVIAIILGVAAAAGVLYAAWQTLRADDELWVADDPLRAPDA